MAQGKCTPQHPELWKRRGRRPAAAPGGGEQILEVEGEDEGEEGGEGVGRGGGPAGVVRWDAGRYSIFALGGGDGGEGTSSGDDGSDGSEA